MTTRTELSVVLSVAFLTLAGVSSAQRMNHTERGSGSLKMQRGTQRVNRVTYDLNGTGGGNIRIRTDRRTFDLHPENFRMVNNRATFQFSRPYRGTGHAEFRNGRMVSIGLDLNGSDGLMNVDFTTGNFGLGNQNARNLNRALGWSQINQNNPYGYGWPVWGANTWYSNGGNAVNWTSVRHGQGEIRWNGHGTASMSSAQVSGQRDGDTRIMLTGRDSGVFIGRSRRNGNIILLQLTSAFGERVQSGTARITLSRELGQFSTIELSGRDRDGMAFRATFDARG